MGPDDPASAPKMDVRKRMIAERSSLLPEEWEVRSRALTGRLVCLDCIALAEHVMIYLPYVMRREVDTSMLLSWLEAAGKIVSVPVVRGRDLVPSLFHAGDPVAAATFGQPEPKNPVFSQSMPSVVIVPVVAADRSGVRIGYGAGFYDRFFHTLRRTGREAAAVGICFSFQVLDLLPSDPWDVKLDMIVTDKDVINIQ